MNIEISASPSSLIQYICASAVDNSEKRTRDFALLEMLAITDYLAGTDGAAILGVARVVIVKN